MFEFDAIMLLSYNVFILNFQQSFNDRFSKLLYNLSIYNVYNQVSEINIANNYVIIFLYSVYFNSWWFILFIYPKLSDKLYTIKPDLSIHCVWN